MNRLPLLLLIPLLLTACPPPPIPCPPNCPPPATATPTNPPTWPTPRPTATPSPTVRPTAVPPVQVQQLTRGRALVRLDLRGFVPTPGQDYFVLSSLMWSGTDKHAPALELSVRGTEAAPCLALPCGPSRLGLVARFSGDIANDGKLAGEGKPESSFCGEGVKYSARLPIGPSPLVDVLLEWDPSGVLVTTPTNAFRWLKQGSPRVGFGAFFVPVPSPPKGIGWGYGPALVLGRASLLSWEAVGSDPQPPLGACP